MLPLIWFLVVSGVAIFVWRLIVHDKNEREMRNDSKNNKE
jgi:hypothetical protein